MFWCPASEPMPTFRIIFYHIHVVGVAFVHNYKAETLVYPASLAAKICVHNLDLANFCTHIRHWIGSYWPEKSGQRILSSGRWLLWSVHIQFPGAVGIARVVNPDGALHVPCPRWWRCCGLWHPVSRNSGSLSTQNWFGLWSSILTGLLKFLLSSRSSSPKI